MKSAWAWTLLLLVACEGAGDRGDPSGNWRDGAGEEADAAVARSDGDALATDPLDGALHDAGSVDDGALGDASVVGAVDAGPVDAGALDGSAPFDAGVGPCTGVNVPGDYATVQGAVTALMAAGGGVVCVGTIVVQPGFTYGEAVQISGAGRLELIGLSPDESQLGYIRIEPASGPPNLINVLIRGVSAYALTFERAWFAAGSSLTAEAIRLGQISATPNVGAAIHFGCGTAPVAVTIDRVDVQATVGIGIDGCMGLDSGDVLIRNTFVHDSVTGVFLQFSGNRGVVGHSLQVLNNTFSANRVGLDVRSVAASVRYSNNLFVGNETGVTTEVGFDHSNNAFDGNVSNYGGLATPGPGYVLSGLNLIPGAPPVPGPGSSALGAADPALAPALDFHGLPRDAAPDIGAAERR